MQVTGHPDRDPPGPWRGRAGARRLPLHPHRAEHFARRHVQHGLHDGRHQLWLPAARVCDVRASAAAPAAAPAAARTQRARARHPRVPKLRVPQEDYSRVRAETTFTIYTQVMRATASEWDKKKDLICVCLHFLLPCWLLSVCYWDNGFLRDMRRKKA